MLISCGAALFGLRLAVRSLGYVPVVELLPDPARLRLLARVRLGEAAPMTAAERKMLEAVPHRHTHRGAFEPDPLPDGLLARLQHDAIAEGATLALTDRALLPKLVAITAPVGRIRDRDQANRDEVRRWTRDATEPGATGYRRMRSRAGPPTRPGGCRSATSTSGRGLGLLTDGGRRPAATAVLLTSRDRRADWLRVGQALQRLLLHAASQWVFAALYTQPLEAAAIRQQIKTAWPCPGGRR